MAAVLPYPHNKRAVRSPDKETGPPTYKGDYRMTTTEHESYCVHRFGSDHLGADCGRCERGDCDEQRVPRWIARKNESGLPDKDMTGYAA